MTRQEQRNSRIAEEHAGLLIALECAVPLRIAELARMSPRARARVIELDAARAADQVAHRGDALMYGGKRGEAAGVFNALTKGLAAAAFQPGGITVFGHHWCTNHAECEQATAEAASRLAEPTPAELMPDDDEPDEAGEWYGDRRVEAIQPAEEYL